MSKKFQFKRGLRANLPTLAEAEPAFTTDDGKFHVGSSAGNVTMAREDHTHTLAQVSESADKKPLYLAVASSTDGVVYTATIDGITSLYTGLTITIIPNLQSTSRTPTLNVNGLGAKRMVMPINGSNTSSTTQPPVVYNDDTTEDELNGKIAVASKWLTANKPVTVRYDGTYWETDLVAQSASCLYGTVPIESGGTGANNAAAARANLGAASVSDLNNAMAECVKSVNGVTPDDSGNVTVQVQAEQIPIVDSIDEMTDTSKRYVLKSTGTIHQYKESTYEETITITDEIDDTTYYDGSRLSSSATNLTDGISNDVPNTGYHVTPLIDLTKAEYQGKTIKIHLEGAHYMSESTCETYIMHRYYKTDGSVQYIRGFSYPGQFDSMAEWKNANFAIESNTSATITINMPLLFGSGNVECGYLRFCGQGAVADSYIYITYQTTQTVTEKTWVDTGVSFGGNGIDEETLAEIAKISKLNNEGADPTTIKLLPSPVLDFYNASDYPSDDYTTSHLSKITYPCRADIPVPFNVKWEHNENAMRTTVAVDTKAIGTNNAYTLKTYDATGSDNYPLFNLLPNTRYYYKVTHVMADGSLVEAKSGNFLTSSEPWRLLYIEGTQNVRDLGGWTGLNGKKVKYGKIIRGAALSDSSYPELMLTGKGKRALGDLKIQAELNLGAADTETSVSATCSYHRVGYSNYAIAITDATVKASFKTTLEKIVSWLSESTPRNIYMHCQGGCDRTGTLAFQLLGLLGVSESDLAKEYELSSFSDIGFGRLRTTTKAVDVYDYVGMVEAIKAYSGTTITEKFYDFATTGCGISADTITAFRNLMLE